MVLGKGFEHFCAVRRVGRLLRAAMFALALAGECYGATAENSSPLLEAASPYLRAHAADPVNWHVWGTRAFAEAKTTNKLVFLSIGYSACHWCHVMARESFRDAATAKLLNKRFVSILVDREASPDIDALYQQAAATMNLPTGWPLNLVLLPNGTPIDGGTYFPPERRQGMPSFTEFLDAVWQGYQENPGGLTLRATAVAKALADGTAGMAGEISRAAIDGAVRRLLDQVDSFYGGFGDAPKFPYPSALQALWRAYLRSGEAEFRDSVLLSLRSMAQGGLYDHLGGGFARYATDPAWNIPHFEKLLDLNAQLLSLLVEAWPETREPLFAARVRETVRFLLHEMQLPDGAFAAAIDSDSEGREGAFYVWTVREIDDSLGADAPLFKQAYGVTDEGNWEDVNVLTRNHASLVELSIETGLDEREITKRLARARQALAMTRDRRPRPLRDDKALADWNGLAIAALAEAGAAFGEPEWINAARAAFAAVEPMAEEGTGLRHFQYAGTPGPPAMLDDYIQMARAALALFEITGELRYLSLARAWGEAADVFHDESEGGFFQTAPGSGAGDMPRFKPWLDEQMPSGNAAAAELMARLYFLTGDDGYRQRSEDTIRVYFGEATKEPLQHGAMLVASDTLLGAIQIVVVGRRDELMTRRLLTGIWETSLPGRVLQVIAPGDSLPEGHPAQGKGQIDGRPTAYVCRGTFCSLPVTGVAELVATLKDIRKGRVQRSSDADRTDQR